MKPLKRASVTARNLTLNYGKTEVLRDVSFTVSPGEFFALIGPSGSGKTTLLRLIAGFSPGHSGQVLIDGQDVSSQAPHLRNVGVVFQNYALWPHLNAWDNVAFGLVEKRLPRDHIASKVQAVLALVGLAGFADRKPSTLSGGQQQRVALARTPVVEPQVLLLDEPFSNLDKQLRAGMRQELRNLQRSLGLTTILVTHDQEEAMSTADRIAVLEAGVLQQTGTPAGLFDYPKNRFVAGFVGTANLLEGTINHVSRDLVHFQVPGLPLLCLPRQPQSTPRPGAAAMTFRPHQMALRVGDEQVAPVDASRIWLSGHVHSVEFLGEFLRYKVRVGGHVVVADHPHCAGLAPFAPGVPVRLGLDPAQVRFLS